MSDDLERLTARIEADITRYEKTMAKVGVIFDQQAATVEKRNTGLVQRLNRAWGSLNFGQVAGLVGVGLSLEKLIDSSKEFAEATLSVSRATGISAETIQGLGLVAQKSGVEQADLNKALEFFGAQMGEAELHATTFSKVMAALGVSLKAGPEKALLSLADKLALLPKVQQDFIAKTAFGRGGVADIPWLTQGSKAIQTMIADFTRLGLVVPTGKLERINDIFDQLKEIKTATLTGFMEGFADFAGNIESAAFQSSVKAFGESLGDIAGVLVKAAPYWKQLLEIFATFQGFKGGAMLGSMFGPEGTVIGGLAGGAFGFLGTRALVNHQDGGGEAATLQQRIDALNDQIAQIEKSLAQPNTFGGHIGAQQQFIASQKAQLAELTAQRDALAKTVPSGAPKGGGVDLSGLLDQDNINQVKARIADLNKQLDQELSESASKGEDAYIDLTKAQGDYQLEQLKGTVAFFDLQSRLINQAADLDIQRINERKEADLKAIADRAAAQIASVNALNADPATKAAERVKIEQAADQQMVDSSARAADEIDAIRAKQNQQLLQNNQTYQRQLQDNIQFADQFRSGLEDVGAAGLKGFKSLEQAAGNFLEQIAELIVKLYVMKPLIEGAFGPSGTPLPGAGSGGFLGGIFSGIGSLLGFAGGGRPPVGRASIVGERGPELFVPDQSGIIVPTGAPVGIPRAVAASQPSSVMISIDARGAQLGVAEQIEAKLRAAVPTILQAADRQNAAAFPARLRVTQRDKF